MRRRIRKALSRVPLHLVVITIAFIWMLPSLGLLISSFRSGRAIKSTGWWTVFTTPFDFTQWTPENYAGVITAEGLGQSFRNSLAISIPATILPIMIASLAAYALAWMNFRGRELIFSIIVGLLVVPLQMTFIPVFRAFARMGVAGTFLAIWAAHIGYGLPFGIYLLRNFFASIPNDLFESAYLDGASHLTAFYYLALPLSVPSLASLAIFQFLWVWNDLLVALIYLGGTPQVAPLTVRVANLVNSLGADWHLLPAAAFLSMILPLLVFFSMQKYFVRGILAGSVKG